MNPEGMTPRNLFEKEQDDNKVAKKMQTPYAAPELWLSANEDIKVSQTRMDALKDSAQSEAEVYNGVVNEIAGRTGDMDDAKDIVLGGNRIEMRNSTEFNLSKVKDFTELYTKIIQNGGLTASFGHEPAEYWIGAIENVRAGNAEFNTMTSKSGLRAKVKELLGNNEGAEVYSEDPEGDIAAIEAVRAEHSPSE